MVKFGPKQTAPSAIPESRPTQTLDRFLYRPESPASIMSAASREVAIIADPSEASDSTSSQTPASGMVTPLTAEVLDAKLDHLLQNLTHNITREVGKLAQELRGELAHLGERTDTLENKFDDMIQYMHVVEEDNAALKHSISLLQSQQEDLENRERRQNLRIRGIPETVSDREIRSYLLSLFNVLVPLIPDIDWRMDRAHRSLAPKPPAGANPRDIIVRFHYYESKEALVMATRNKSRLEFKGAKLQIFSDLSPITLAKRRSFRSITSHLQNHQISYRWGFPFRLSASRDGVQYSMRDLQEGEAFVRNLGLPPLPEEDPRPLPTTPIALSMPGRIWTPGRQKSQKTFSTPKRFPSSRLPT